MEQFYGFDLGDAESAVARTRKDAPGEEPKILPVCDAPSFITAYARLSDGRLLIGESACYSADAVTRRVRFKSRFLSDPACVKDIRTFAAGVLAELIGSGNLVKENDNVVYIGCPAGWQKTDRERYRAIFEQTGYPPVRIVSESRAALISACLSRHLQIGYDILSKSVLVVDVGSSTTDFAFIESGREVELHTAGEVMLGGGITDEMLLRESVLASPDSAAIQKILDESEPWRSYCEFAARRLKEKYFSDEEYWASRSCSRNIEILPSADTKGSAAAGRKESAAGGRKESATAGHMLTIRMDRAMAKKLMEAPAPGLDGRSFQEAFCESLRLVREKIGKPELLFLTGGVSKLPAIRTWCQEAFPETTVITTAQPEFSVARGLAHSGRIDEDMKEFRREVDDLIETSTVERIVSARMEQLYNSIVDTLTDPILETAAMHVFDRWRSGEISRLSEIDEELRKEIEHYLRSEEAQKLLGTVVSSWLRPVAYELEEYTMPICVRHNVPYRALNLTSYLSLSDIDIRIDTKDIFGIEQITWLINTIITILVSLLCGGSGIALIAGGLKGILAGAILSLGVLLIGQEHMENTMMDLNIPKPLRRLITRNAFGGRLHRISTEVKANFYSNLENEKNEELTARLASEISAQIEECLKKMAQVVEIPLG